MSFVPITLNQDEVKPWFDTWKDVADSLRVQFFDPPPGTEALMPTVNVETVPAPGKLPCERPFKHMMINADGSGTPCCFHGELPSLGNIRDKSLQDMWHGPEMQRLRWLLNTGMWEHREPCSRCLVKKRR
jgi:MoaA/NifB/PqqE/SkfB family radical SAM enzyme